MLEFKKLHGIIFAISGNNGSFFIYIWRRLKKLRDAILGFKLNFAFKADSVCGKVAPNNACTLSPANINSLLLILQILDS